MLRAPSRRKRRGAVKNLNLIPILDAVFIFIFFLLVSANFIKIYEIASDVPIVSNAEPPKNKKPLALTVTMTNSGFNLFTGIPSRVYGRIPKKNNEYNYEGLHQRLVQIKQKFKNERSVIFEPKVDLEYGDIIKAMDSIRMLRKTDPEFFKKETQEGISLDVRHYELFDKIVFGNIQDIKR